MVMKKTSIAEVKARLSEYVARVEGGERIVICRHNKPIAELGPVADTRTEPRPLGPLPGRPAFAVGEAFLEPLSDAELDAWDGGVLPSLSASRRTETAHGSKVAERKATYESGAAPRGRTARRRS